MAAEDLNLSNDIEAELHPHVVIIANDTIRYSTFADFLIKGDFPCTTHTELSPNLPTAGTVFFVSYNLKSADSAQLAKTIEQKLKMICIVFAEDEGTQTATKLSSAKMTQTLQYPYTEKNFLMAMQTIVKKRKAQHEKDLRKKQHDERQKARQKAKEPEVAEAQADLTFKRAATEASAQGGVIFQSAAEHLIDDSAKVFKGETLRSQTLVQKFAPTDSFMIIQEGPTAKASAKREPVSGLGAKAKPSVDGMFLGGTAPPVELQPNAQTQSVTLTQGPEAEAPSAPSHDAVRTVAPPESEYPPSLVWTIVAMCLLGSAICPYCVHQILFP